MSEQKFLYNKLGDALKYVLLQELKDENEGEKLDNFFSAMCYMYFHKLLSYETITYFQRFYLTMEVDKFSYESKCQLLAANLMDDPVLKKLIPKGKDFEEVLKKLNDFEIDDWIINEREVLFFTIPRARLVGNQLFYFQGRNKEAKLMMAYTHNLFMGKSLEEAAELVSDRLVDFLDPEITPKNDYIYLLYKHWDNHFCRFSDYKNVEEYYVGKPLGFLGDAPIVATELDDELWVTINMAGKVTKLMKYQEGNSYVVKPKYILVCPGSGTTEFYRPYRFFYSGRRKKCSYEEAAQVLWYKLYPMIMDELAPQELDCNKSTFLRRELYKKVPESFTVDSMLNIFDNITFKMPTHKRENLDNFLHMLKAIFQAMGGDYDLMELLYIMIDITLQCFFNFASNSFPSQMLYEGVICLAVKGELREFLQDTRNLSQRLYLEVGEDKVCVNRRLKTDSPHLGTFAIKGKELAYDVVPWESCIMVGGSLVPAIRELEEGLVTMDTHTGVYYLYYDKLLDEVESEMVAYVFDLLGKEFVWVKKG